MSHLSNATSQPAQQAKQQRFKDVPGVDKVEVFWLNRVMGTPFLSHPVARVRAQNILKDIEQSLKSLPLLAHQAG